MICTSSLAVAVLCGALLLGRRTYEDFFSVWPNRTDNPYTTVLNNTTKYVASTTLREPLPWQNSILLQGNVSDAVARLKAQPGKDLIIFGSSDLAVTFLQQALEQRGIDADGRVVGAFAATGIRPKAMEQLERYGVDPVAVARRYAGG